MSGTQPSASGSSGSASAVMTSQHKMKYKNVGLDSAELRRRREEEGIQLRKQKRDEQMFKKRNLNANDDSIQVIITITNLY